MRSDIGSGKQSSITVTGKGVRKMKDTLIKIIRYFCLLCVIAFGLITIVGSNGGEDGGNGSTTDTTLPSVPAGLTATAVSSSQIDLSWTASTDNVDVTGYKVYRDGSYLKSVTSTSTSDTGLSSSTQYCYTVTAYDTAGNESNQSTQACATTLLFPIATTANMEMSISAAFDGTNWLVSITGEQIAAQLVSQSGTLVENLIPISNIDGATRVGFDGTNYLLVYLDFTPSPNEIKGQFIDTSGSLVGTSFTINTFNTDTAFSGLAYGGGNYFVVYYEEVDDATSDSKVYGRIVGTDGTVSNEITISSGFGDFGRDNVAFDGINFLVVWTDDDNDYEVKGRFVSPTGVLGTEFSINASTYPSDNPLSVAFDGTNYLVVWCDMVGGYDSHEWDIFGQLVDASGNLVGGVISVSTATGHQSFPLIAFDGTNYLVVWTDGRNDANDHGVCDSGEGTCWDVYGQFISTSGSLVGSEFSINSDAGNQLGAVSYGGGKYLVLVNNIDTFDGTVGDVYGMFITP